MKTFPYVLLGLAIALALVVMIALASQTPQMKARSEAEDAVKAQLKDAGSADFRNEEIYTTKQNHIIVCGEVNGRNGFGGMSGFTRFFYLGERAIIDDSTDRGGQFNELWNVAGCDGDKGFAVGTNPV